MSGELTNNNHNNNNNNDEGIRLIVRDKSQINPKFLIIFQKIICLLHDKDCSPASFSFRSNLEYMKASYFCPTGHRLEVSSLIKVEVKSE